MNPNGCWFCGQESELDAFSLEFDGYVHTDCIRGALAKDPTNPEAQIMAEELL